MKTVLGPFHPHLENALIEDVRNHKSKNLLSPLLILVPSDSLRRRLKIALAAENEMKLLNLYLLTFHQLYLRLSEENWPRLAPVLAEDFILEEALGYWIKRGGVETAPFLPIAEKAGGCAALWQTLRDLKDGGVNPAHLASALEEGLCHERDKEKLTSLVKLYESFNEGCRACGVRDYAGWVSSVREHIRSSRFLNQFERILYYGFYDLTQVQLDFFHDLARQYPTTLFFPLVQDHPGWTFAQRFYERHLQGLASKEEHLCRPIHEACSLPLFYDDMPLAAPEIAHSRRYAIISCSGPRDEILVAAKEILRLTRDEGLAFSDIGIVARTLEPYTDWIKEVFRAHRIPVSSSAEEPLLQSPLAKAVMLLLGLAQKDYLRSHFVDLVSSPLFRLPPLFPQQTEPRPDLWDVLTRRLGITKGPEEWARLKRYLDRDFESTAGEEDNGETNKLRVASGQVAILWRLFTELHHDLSGLPTEASWSEYVRLWQALLQKYLILRDTEATTSASSDKGIQTSLAETLVALSMLDAVEPGISLARFIQAFQRRLEQKSAPLSDQNLRGVTIVDAMAARGLRFRAAFLLGLNEGLFPRTIREDPFLRDRARRVMETVLGYKVSEKLAAFDEEKLIFTLLVGSAGERLYCLYQRSDDASRALEPSWYVTELERALSATGRTPTKLIIPRGIRDKKDVEPFRSADFLLPEELAIRLSLDREDLDSVLSLFPTTQALCRPGSQLLDLLEDANGKLSPYDGVTGHLPEYWSDLQNKGVAPTALERYVACPFQFFASHILDLRPVKRPEEQSVMESSEIGKLIHAVLKAFFQKLIDGGFFSGSGESIDLDCLLESIARGIFRDYEAEKPVGYRILWEIIQEQIITLVREQVRRDLKDLREAGRSPVGLEIDLRGQLPTDWPRPAAALPIHGALDRIDFDHKTMSYRVVDYKFTMRNKPSTADNNLRLAAIRGQKLQPPLYLFLAKEFAAQNNIKATASEAAFYYLAPQWDEGPLLQQLFSSEDLEGACGQSLRETVSLLIRGIYDGLYFIQPGDACRACEVAHVCRKNHLPTSWRTAHDSLTQAHAEAVKRDMPKE